MTDSINRPLKVFLCHSSGDKATVRKLYHQLNDEGWIDAWLDEIKILPGQDWDLEIEKAVEEADVVIVCLSSHSVNKEGYVQKELRFVLDVADEKPEGSIFVIPLKLDDCIVPRRLRLWQWVNYFPEIQRPIAYDSLLESFTVRARKLGITFDKPKEESVLKPVERVSFVHTRDKLAPVISKQKQQMAEATITGSVLQQAIPWRFITGIAGGLALLLLFIWGGTSLWNNQSRATRNPQPVKTDASSSIETSIYSTPTPGIGSSMISDKDGMTMLYVPAGKFVMGSEDGDDDEKPMHTVILNAFWIDQTEVTNAMFATFIDETGYISDAEKLGRSVAYQEGSVSIVDGVDWMHPSGPSSGISDIMDHPVVHVSWNDAQAYCSWANRRLPTEAEWEKAASWDGRNQQKYIYPWGNEFQGNLVNFCDKNCSSSWADRNSDDGYEFTAPVGTYPNGASPYGALDMAGNVAEWVSSLQRSYPYSTAYGREDLAAGDPRVLRGGMWDRPSAHVRSTVRMAAYPNYSEDNFGFRCAMSASP